MSDIVEKAQQAIMGIHCAGVKYCFPEEECACRKAARASIRAVLDAIASDGDLIISVARQRARDEGYDPDFMMRDLTGPEYAAWTTFVDDVRDVFAALRKEIEDA